MVNGDWWVEQVVVNGDWWVEQVMVTGGWSRLW